MSPIQYQPPKKSLNRLDRTPRSNTSLIWMGLLVIILMVLSILTGAYDISQEGGWMMVWITRIPRTLALVCSGSAMAISGLVMQLITQNRFVEPTTTGTTEWAGLGLLAVYLIIPNPTLVERMTGAIVASFVGTTLFFLCLRQIRLKSSYTVPIIGMMFGAVISAVSTFLGLAFNMTQPIENWFVGSFANVQVGRYEYLWFVLVIAIIIYYFADQITVAGMGEDIALNLGVNYQRVVFIATGLIACAVGIVTAVIGNLPFLGLIVPNLITLYRGDQLKLNLPWVALLGMVILLSADLLARVVIAPFELPVSVILGILGSVVFLLLVFQQRRGAR